MIIRPEMVSTCEQQECSLPIAHLNTPRAWSFGNRARSNAAHWSASGITPSAVTRSLKITSRNLVNRSWVKAESISEHSCSPRAVKTVSRTVGSFSCGMSTSRISSRSLHELIPARNCGIQPHCVFLWGRSKSFSREVLQLRFRMSP